MATLQLEFRPDTTSKFCEITPHGRQRFSLIKAQSISQAGGVIVITAHTRNDGSIGYGLTHKTTGASLTGANLTCDIGSLAKRARAFWRCLDSSQRRVWQMSLDPAEISQAVTSTAVSCLKR